MQVVTKSGLTILFIFQACPLNAQLARDPNDNSSEWEDFYDFYTPAIISVVNFAKSVPGFGLLNQDDQVTLLKV